MKKIHYISGLTLTVFIGFHLLNHFCSIWGAEKHIEVMCLFRLIYRNIVVETILVIAAVMQIISGFKLVFINHTKANTFFEWLHICSGLYLAFFLSIHVSAVLIGRFFLHLDTNFYFGVAGLNNFPFNLFFIPYYALAIIAFFGHIAAIHHKKTSHSSQAKAILICGFALTIIIFYGLTNHFQGVEIPKEYGVLIGR